MRWLGYAWTVAVNCFYLFVVLWAFDKIENRHELTITVAILGLIYVAIRTSSMYQFTAMLEIFSQTKSSFSSFKNLSAILSTKQIRESGTKQRRSSKRAASNFTSMPSSSG